MISIYEGGGSGDDFRLRTSRDWWHFSRKMARDTRQRGYHRSAAFWREMAWRALFGRVPVT
jgi:hypothetical protein